MAAAAAAAAAAEGGGWMIVNDKDVYIHFMGHCLWKETTLSKCRRRLDIRLEDAGVVLGGAMHRSIKSNPEAFPYACFMQLMYTETKPQRPITT